MKLTIKTLQQSVFRVDIEPDKTVKELKDKIEKDHGKDYPSAAQKLIYSGRILSDENKLAEYEIDEKKFIVLMITRPPPVQKQPPPATEKQSTGTTKKDDTSSSKSTLSPSPAPSKLTETDTTSSKPSAQSSSTAATTTTTTPATATVTQSATTTTESRQAGGGGVGVGFRSSAAATALNEAASILPMSEPQMASRMASLMTQPQFRQIQDLIQQSPHLLSSTIEALAASDPEMYSFISENPDVFVSALNHPPLAGSRTHSSSRSSTTTGGQQRPSGEHQAASAGRNSNIPANLPSSGRRQADMLDQALIGVTERDKEAIERLKELGFSEYLAIQAYMACDKDEQLAANLLFQMDQ